MLSRRIPAADCPHRLDQHVRTATATQCARCDATEHLRLCTTCGKVFCCESDNAHNREHYQETGHPIIVSVPPESPNRFTWCWACNAYLTEE